MKIHDKNKLQNQNDCKVISEAKFNSFDDFIGFISENEDNFDDCLYRGQKDHTWKLEPSFYRKIDTKLDDGSALLDYSFKHLELFKKYTRGRHNIAYDNPNDQDENWWALLRGVTGLDFFILQQKSIIMQLKNYLIFWQPV